MRARLAVTLALVATAVPAGAEAGPARTYKGDLDAGGTVAFDLKRKPGGVRKVVSWRWRNLPIECAGSATSKLDGEFGRPWLKVDDARTFSGRAEPTPPREGFAEVHGAFPRSWRKAEGTFEVGGDTSQGDDCTSGAEPVAWTARRV